MSQLAQQGANLAVRLPDGSDFGSELGPDRATTWVIFHDEPALDALLRGDHLALAEAFLAERVDVLGDLREAIRVTDYLDVAPHRLAAVAFWLRFFLDRRRFNRSSVAF